MILFFAWSMTTHISTIVGLSSPSTILKNIRRGREALMQSSTACQNATDKTCFSYFSVLQFALTSLTKRAFNPCLCFHTLANVRKDVANQIVACLTRSLPLSWTLGPHKVMNPSMFIDKSDYLLWFSSAATKLFYFPNTFQHEIQAVGNTRRQNRQETCPSAASY
jgi:hypothetical protein